MNAEILFLMVHKVLILRLNFTLAVKQNASGCVLPLKAMSDASGPSSTSFWRQDVNWYVQQQSWTRSFYAADQSWTQRLEASNLASPVAPADPPDVPNVTGQKLAKLLDSQTGQGLVNSLQSTSVTDASGQVTSGYLLNLLA